MANPDATTSTDSEKRARIILDRAYDAFIEIDSNNIIVDWNTRAEITFGWTREQVIGKTFTEVIIPLRNRESQHEGLKRFQKQAKLKSNISNKQIEITVLSRDEKEFVAEMTVFPVDTGHTVNLGIFIRNISGRKMAEEAESNGEEKFRLLVSGVRDYAIIMLDPAGLIKTWNEGATRIEGYSSDEIIGKHFSCFYTSKDKSTDKSKQILLTAIKYGRYEEDGQRVRKDGSQFWANVVINPIYDQHEKLIGFAKVTRDISEWKTHDGNFRRLLELAPDAMVVADQLGNIVLVNSETESIFGYSKDELVGLKLEKLIPNHSQFLVSPHARTTSKGLELYALRKDGTEFPVEISLSPLKAAEGLLISTAIRDITERKQFERDLLKQKKLFQTILDSLADGVVVADNEGKFLVSNRAAQTMTGIDYSDIPVDEWSKRYGFYLADTKTLYQTEDLPLVRAMRGEVTVDAEIFVRNANLPQGAWLKVNGAPMAVDEGANSVGLVVFRDISKNKEIEENNAQLAAIVESTGDTITGSDLAGAITSWNSAATSLFGYSKEEAMGQSDSMVIPADRLEEERTFINGFEPTNSVTQHYETVRKAKSGNLVAVSITISPIKDSTGKIVGTSKITRDITERKKSEFIQIALAAELKRSNLELEQFASVASHDLQEPLRGVAGCLQIIEDRYKGKGDEKTDELLRHAMDGVARMHTLIRDLLSLSRVTSEGIAVEATDLNLLYRKALTNVEVSIKESDASITCDKLPTLAVDSTQIVQVFQNLISNAIKFRAKRKLNIHVGAKLEGKHWIFSIKDNGIGFKQEYSDRIFLPFRRLKSKEDYAGTGIGLAICKRIVERHGGKIWAESEEGKGATFYFTVELNNGKFN